MIQLWVLLQPRCTMYSIVKLCCTRSVNLAFTTSILFMQFILPEDLGKKGQIGPPSCFVLPDRPTIVFCSARSMYLSTGPGIIVMIYTQVEAWYKMSTFFFYYEIVLPPCMVYNC